MEKNPNIPINDVILSDLLTSKGTYNIPKVLINRFENFDKALMLSNYIDKYKQFAKSPTFNGWFYLTHEKQSKTLYFPESKIIKIKQEFIQLGFISIKTIGLPAKQWLRLNFNIIAEFIYNSQPIKIQRQDPYFFGGLYPNGNGGLNNKTLKSNKTNNYNIIRTRKITPNQFDSFWELYPRKTDKGSAKKVWEKLCAKKDKPEWSEIKKAIEAQKESERWNSGAIKYPTTWLNNYGWLDDPEQMTVPKDFKQKSNPTTAGYRRDAITYQTPIKV